MGFVSRATVGLSDPYFGKLGFLVIDTAYHGRSVGGVRILPDVTLDEISSMARTQTKKYLFSGIRAGGAKAGLVLKGKAADDRRGALLAFGRAISPYVRSGFWPGCDMGSSIEDIRTILWGAGLPSFQKDGPSSHKYTAWSVVASIGAALERKEKGWSGCRIAIEGFGKVGSIVAAMAEERGAKVVAISNTSGCALKPDGFDTDAIRQLRDEQGSGFITRLEGFCAKEGIFGADCDVFVPCARCWSINASNADTIEADMIVCGANVPMTRECERHLWSKGKLIVPDAVANCGGVVGNTLARHLKDDRIGGIFNTRFRERVHQVLDKGEPPSDYVDRFCLRRAEELCAALAPTSRGPLSMAIDHLSYHLVEPFFSDSAIEDRLFPE